MLASTHYIIADSVYDNIKKITGYNLNKRLFKWGNIKPDVDFKLLSKSHYKDESFDFVIENIYKILNTEFDFNNKYYKNKLSVDLGIISHFLTDFFCIPHSQGWHFNTEMKKHIKYEIKLHKKAKRYNYNAKIIAPNIGVINKSNIKKLIEELHFDYRKIEDYKNDLKSSIDVSSIISAMALNYILKENKEIKVTA
ncbi:MAG: zinc dependent phospholipase C family protein [Firmicutes bacterium]|nr:zinc dependent phospholipase C family protein [Bacillota bacterium]